MKVGLALRSTVFSPSLVARVIPLVDKSRLDSVWFPSVRTTFDALDLCGISLGASQRLRAGTGVIRWDEYDPIKLTARVRTLVEGSGNRFILGLGTGSDLGGPAIGQMIKTAGTIRSGYPESVRPQIFFAALRARILRTAFRNAEGAILNFCSAEYAKKVASSGPKPDDFTLSCYIKLFFAEHDEDARKMLVDEMRMYDGLPQYHEMFEAMGVSDELVRITPEYIPEKLREISLANPTDEEILLTTRNFLEAGIDLPIIYPYASGTADYKLALVERLCTLL